MDQTKQQHAYQRGARIARLWKKVKSGVLFWDQRCLSWANKKHIPSWIGHIPIILFIVLFISAIAFGALIIATCFLFIFAVACIIQNPGSSQAKVDETEFYDDTEKTGPGYRYGQEGHGYYSGSNDITSERLD